MVEAVETLTRNAETYADYIRRMCESGDRVALHVKRADLEFNITQAGLPGDDPDARFVGLAVERWLPALGLVLAALGHVE